MISFYACDTTQKDEEKESVGEESTEIVKEEITIEKIAETPDFPDAIIEQNEPAEGAKLEPGMNKFSYEVTNYELSAQTIDADVRKCANSPDGQHIHLILNNEPYTPYYDAEFEHELEEGHYVALSFLSRSYHESLKQYDAYVLRQFTVGDADEDDVDLSTPHMFYSRPKGEYVGEDTERILLDFYLINTDLSPDGNKVRAKVDGEEFMITSWEPYAIEGLSMGEHTVALELVDNEGNVIDGPYNSVERTFTLKEE